VSLALALACLWVVVATLLALLPSPRRHWPAAWFLIATGIPILGLVAWRHGPVVGLLVLAGGASILRWPLWHLWRWVLGRAGGAGAGRGAGPAGPGTPGPAPPGAGTAPPRR